MGRHIHRPYALPLSRQHPSLKRAIRTTLSSRLLGSSPNSFNRLDYQISTDKRAQVQRWDYQDDAFALAASLALSW